MRRAPQIAHIGFIPPGVTLTPDVVASSGENSTPGDSGIRGAGATSHGWRLLTLVPKGAGSPDESLRPASRERLDVHPPAPPRRPSPVGLKRSQRSRGF